jgi:hypothetical protein
MMTGALAINLQKTLGQSMSSTTITIDAIKSAIRMQGSRNWALVADPSREATWSDIADITVTLNISSSIITVEPVGGFEPLYTYSVRFIKDIATSSGSLVINNDFIFSTLINRTSGYDLIKSLDDKVLLDIKPNALLANAFIGIKPIGKDEISGRTDILNADAEISRERYMMPVEGLMYEVVGGTGAIRAEGDKTIKEITQRGYFSIIYYNNNGDGLVDGLNVKPTQLYLASLNAQTKKWELITQIGTSGLSIKEQNTYKAATSPQYKVTFGITKFGVYRVIALAELQEAAMNLINYPNPFVPDAVVSDTIFGINISGKGTIVYAEIQSVVDKINVAVYSLFGLLVRTWEYSANDIQMRKLTNGGFWFDWDGRNGSGNIVSNGVYIMKFEAKVGTTKKVLTRKIAVW